MEAYLEGVEPDETTLKMLIRKGSLDQAFVPVTCGSAFKNKGVQVGIWHGEWKPRLCLRSLRLQTLFVCVMTYAKEFTLHWQQLSNSGSNNGARMDWTAACKTDAHFPCCLSRRYWPRGWKAC